MDPVERVAGVLSQRARFLKKGERQYLDINYASKSFAFFASVIDYLIRIGRTGFSLSPVRRVR